MKHLKLFEDFKVKNITVDDIVDCIQKSGSIYATIVKDLPDNNPETSLKPVSIDEDGLVTVLIDGDEYEVDLKDVKRIEESLSTRQDVVQTLKDISLDIQDMGYRVLVGEDPAIPSQFGGLHKRRDEYNLKRRVLINIDKNTQGRKPLFDISEIKYYLLRVIGFLESEGFNPVIFVPKRDNPSGSDYTQMFFDKNVKIGEGIFKCENRIFDYPISWLEIKAERVHISESKRSYTKEDHHNLDELVQDIKNIMLDIIDEYQLIDITPSNLEHININDNDIDYELAENPNSYGIYSDVKYTRHGAYGVVIIRINCKKLYDEQAPSMGKEEGLFKELILRLDTIGHSYVEFEETSMVDTLTIEVTPRN